MLLKHCIGRPAHCPVRLDQYVFVCKLSDMCKAFEPCLDETLPQMKLAVQTLNVERFGVHGKKPGGVQHRISLGELYSPQGLTSPTASTKPNKGLTALAHIDFQLRLHLPQIISYWVQVHSLAFLLLHTWEFFYAYRFQCILGKPEQRCGSILYACSYATGYPLALIA